MRLHQFAAAVCLFSLIALAGCSAAPRQRPVKMGPVDTGAGSVESVRRQLQGTWDLVTLDTFPEPGQAAVPIKATAVLSYDEFGNLRMKGRRDGESRGDAAATLLDYNGQAVIDVTKQQLQLIAVSGNLPAGQVPPEVSFKSIRKYAFDGDLLKVSTVDARGNITATSVWKRRAE